MSNPQSPTVRRRRLGLELRRLRDAAGLTTKDVARSLEISEAKINRIERGNLTARVIDVRAMLDLYGLHDPEQREALLTLTRQARERGWWAQYEDVLPTGFETYVGLEADAASLRAFSVTVLHGLLQTEDYARTLIRQVNPGMDGESVDRLVALRCERQRLLDRTPEPLKLWTIIDEAILRRPIGGREVMRAQLQRLLREAERPCVDLQVLPFSKGWHPGLSGAFTLIEFLSDADKDVVYIDGPGGNLYLEKSAEVRQAADTFDRLRAKALDGDESLQMIKAAAKDV
ncbi:helix-turn-helix domain-containing protein [Allostreptomyces psammosilenae]|uniref:Transcriptional regulator with XRE-family HTH domain n=1 Tax=Allostreptomyces psammosilenae TaxID=1892865 RepID=A0A853A0N1_9ACTN|nr:helix-turn-helix transcriptional regulator [Allostreptomyces psammosilenae]NYI07935.1 transcriptional regulator with XRE-family HTH domain [Allostreptomyces psammosilenae]